MTPTRNPSPPVGQIVAAERLDLRTAALHLAARGLPVFPCRSGRKEPATRRGFHDATTDAERVAAWWTETPDANLALVTGGRFWVLDVDPDHGGDDALHDLERQHGGLPRTFSVCTPRGGQHLYWRMPDDRPVGCGAGRVGPGLDHRGTGGYALAPPSRVLGRAYVVDAEVPAVEAPGWLLDLVTDAAANERPTARPAEDWIEMLSSGVPEGRRNSALASLVGHLLARDVNAHVAAALARAVNVTACAPPLPGREVDRITSSIAGREVRQRQEGRHR